MTKTIEAILGKSLKRLRDVPVILIWDQKYHNASTRKCTHLCLLLSTTTTSGSFQAIGPIDHQSVTGSPWIPQIIHFYLLLP